MTKLKGKISFFTSGWQNVNMPCVLEVDGDIGTSPQEETDPTVPAWAKKSNPPTAEDVGALPNSTTLADLTQDENHRTVSDNEKTAWNSKANKIPIVSVASSASSLTCEEDKYYRLDTAVNTFSITLPTVTDVGIAKSVIIYLTTGATPAVTITSTQQLHYSYGFSLEASKTYEINALWNGAAWVITSIEL